MQSESESESSAVHHSKKQRLSSPSPDKKKLCVVVVRSKSYLKGPDVEIEFGVGSDEYQICILDPDSSSGGGVDEYTRSEPTIRFKGCFRDMAWCGLDSTLYLFEGVEKNEHMQASLRSLQEFLLHPII